MLEYASVVRSPQQDSLKTKLEKVQHEYRRLGSITRMLKVL